MCGLLALEEVVTRPRKTSTPRATLTCRKITKVNDIVKPVQEVVKRWGWVDVNMGNWG